MDIPKPPQDIELKNIIDKLAKFVARNGPEFEQMTKNKQKGNAKFSFLFGGEFFNYYQYKVTTEQAILKQKNQNANVGTGPQGLNVILNNQGQPSLNIGGQSLVQWLAAQQSQAQAAVVAQTPVQAPPATSLRTMEQLTSQQAALHDQILESEQNLNAQHSVLMQQQEVAIEEAIQKAQKEHMNAEATECSLNFAEMDAILQPIIDSCTKDSISSGKAWILQRATGKKINSVIASYLLSKLLEDKRTFNHKLHIIYLVNDILHHCARKNSGEDLKKALELVVVPMFCNAASMNATEEQKAKLNKLLNLWETKHHYCSPEIVAKLKTPVESWQQYKAELRSQHNDAVQNITNNTKTTFHSYQSQHQAFVTHALQQIQTIEQQKQTLESQNQAAAALAASAAVSLPSTEPPGVTTQPDQLLQHQLISQPPQHLLPQQQSQQQLLQLQQQAISQMTAEQNHSLGSSNHLQDHGLPQSGIDGIPGFPTAPPDLGVQFTQPPPGFLPTFPPPGPGIELPDLSRPPPGFHLPPPPPIMQPEVMPDDLLPSLPYYDLPAGLMVPLIKLEDCHYKPLDPESIRLPPPAPPSERLLAAVKSFYAPPGHDHPRDSDGWEKLGLYEYYRAKNSAKKRKEDDISNGIRERSRSPSPITRPRSRSRTPPSKKRYRSRSRSKSRGRESRSPPRRNSNSSRREARRSRTGSRRDRSRSRSRSRSRTPPVNKERSPTPPPASFIQPYRNPTTEKLDESNKGHQMLRKMGWGGAGLGAKEQGIEAPISGGEIRDRIDQYKGVGINLNDPYENFRKSKGQAFITRMKARAEERS
ncbi:calcium homeostasis endoplasmic reticulum protein-like isoform X2 [Macrosteles quadrilineatus]|uniref:calcium homeostasis endoplasmic reticulum protein-like isoform X2 n=1 Tax=Macrosteles quadrilineatus TaxID=74068 RepID=UPI0023E1CEAD|nr:calcium homeostasis endoplasmic reticulum protein-like isoform X2 [Macrosteles quadrilineatus]